jgi:CHAD domain-containing protein
MPRPRIWKNHKKTLRKTRRGLLNGGSEGLHDLRVALRRVAVLARATGRKRVDRAARRFARELSRLRQLEIDAHLLDGLPDGLVPAEARNAVEARIALLAADPAARSRRRLGSGKWKRFLRHVGRSNSVSRRRLTKASRKALEKLARLDAAASDENLHRYRLQVKKGRYLLETRIALGEKALQPEAARLKSLQDAIGNWNDLRLFAADLVRIRTLSEEEGAVSLAAHLDVVIRFLEPCIEKARKEALDALQAPLALFPEPAKAGARAAKA